MCSDSENIMQVCWECQEFSTLKHLSNFLFYMHQSRLSPRFPFISTGFWFPLIVKMFPLGVAFHAKCAVHTIACNWYSQKFHISPDIIFLVHAYCIFRTFQVMMFMYHEYIMVLKCSIDFFYFALQLSLWLFVKLLQLKKT